MNTEHTREERADEYVTGRMSAMEREAFEKEMAADPQLTDLVNQLRALAGVAGDMEEKLACMAGWEKELQEERLLGRRRKRRIWLRAAGAAACVCVLAAAVWVVRFGDSSPGGDTSAEPADVGGWHSAVRGADLTDSVAALLRAGEYEAADSVIASLKADTVFPGADSSEIEYQKLLRTRQIEIMEKMRREAKPTYR